MPGRRIGARSVSRQRAAASLRARIARDSARSACGLVSVAAISGWVTSGWRSTPGGGAEGPSKAYFLGLAEMYVADPRFGANYGGQAGAEFVRDAMTAYAERNL